MKKILLILFVLLTFFTLNYLAFAECESDSNQSRIGRLPCPLVLKNCTTLQALEENKYLNKDQVYSVTEVEAACKSCVIKLSRDSECITRGLKKCRKNFTLGPPQI